MADEKPQVVLDPKILGDEDDDKIALFTAAALQALLSRPAWQKVQGHNGAMYAQYPEPTRAAIASVRFGILTATANKQAKKGRNDATQDADSGLEGQQEEDGAGPGDPLRGVRGEPENAKGGGGDKGKDVQGQGSGNTVVPFLRPDEVKPA